MSKNGTARNALADPSRLQPRDQDDEDLLRALRKTLIIPFFNLFKPF
jgi:hypothetical protein